MATSFNWKSLIPVLEMAGNISTLLIPGGAAFAPLETALENALNPLITSIGTGQSTSDTVLMVYATFIGVLNALKQANVAPDVLAKITEYLAACNDAITGYTLAGKGYDPKNYQPVTPIA